MADFIPRPLWPEGSKPLSLVKLGARQIGHDHRRALAGEAQGAGPPDPAGGSGHQAGPALQ